jgi:small subunit ribosomal protein S1
MSEETKNQNNQTAAEPEETSDEKQPVTEEVSEEVVSEEAAATETPEATPEVEEAKPEVEETKEEVLPATTEVTDEVTDEPVIAEEPAVPVETDEPAAPVTPAEPVISADMEKMIDSEDIVYTDAERDELARMYDDTLQEIHAESIIQGRIVGLTDREISVDIGFKSDGVIPRDEIDDITKYKIGDELEVYIDKMENSDGQLLLSKKKADFQRTWGNILSKDKSGDTLEARCIRRIKGGIVVDINGVEAFMPGSQIDIHPVRDFDALIGKVMDCRIVKINEARKNIVVSRKVIIEEDMREVRERVLKELEVGQVREGVVKNITNFGVFIDLGGVDALLHITDLSWGRINHPSEIVELDQKMAVKILDFDRERQRISVSYKELQPHPWDGIEDRYPVEGRVKGKVVSITRYGVFVELEPGIEGLVHISEMSWTQHIKHPSQMVNIGDEIECLVLAIQKSDHKISLGLKQTEANPWIEYETKYVKGSHHSGTIRDLVPFGVFVELEDNVDGLIHISDLSWTRNVRHPGELVKKGDKIDVVVLNFDKDERRISLGHKQLHENPWDKFVTEFNVGDSISTEILKVIEKGVLVKIYDDLEGFVPNSKLSLVDDDGKRRSPQEGETIVARVLECEPRSKKLILSSQAGRLSQDEKDVAEYKKKSRGSTAGGTIGDAIGEALLKSQVTDKSVAVAEEAPEVAEVETPAEPAVETEAAPEAEVTDAAPEEVVEEAPEVAEVETPAEPAVEVEAAPEAEVTDAAPEEVVEEAPVAAEVETPAEPAVEVETTPEAEVTEDAPEEVVEEVAEEVVEETEEAAEEVVKDTTPEASEEPAEENAEDATDADPDDSKEKPEEK